MYKKCIYTKYKYIRNKYYFVLNLKRKIKLLLKSQINSQSILPVSRVFNEMTESRNILDFRGTVTPLKTSMDQFSGV